MKIIKFKFNWVASLTGCGLLIAGICGLKYYDYMAPNCMYDLACKFSFITGIFLLEKFMSLLIIMIGISVIVFSSVTEQNNNNKLKAVKK